MIEGGALLGKYDGELVNEGPNWFVGPVAVDSAAARRLIDLGLVRLISVSHCQSYEIAEHQRAQLNQYQMLARRGARGLTVERICMLLVRRAARRNNDWAC